MRAPPARPLVFLIVSTVLPCVAAQGQFSEPGGARRARMEAFLGYQHWDALSQLQPAAGGGFDSGGFNLGGAFHWRMHERNTTDLLIGLDVALFTNESNVHHIREELTSRGMYITPSMKWMFADGTGPRYSLDIGLGYYLVDIAEVELYDFGGYAEDELWEDSAFGGFIGAGIDFPTATSDRRGGFSMSAKIHFFDLGSVNDEGFRSIVSGTLGSGTGDLSGPVVMLQFGYHWY